MKFKLPLHKGHRTSGYASVRGSLCDEKDYSVPKYIAIVDVMEVGKRYVIGPLECLMGSARLLGTNQSVLPFTEFSCDLITVSTSIILTKVACEEQVRIR